MAFSGMLHLAALVKSDVSEGLSPSIIKVTRIGEVGTTLAVNSVRRLLVTANGVPSSPILFSLMTILTKTATLHLFLKIN
jgi:hypothetical protein